MLTVAWEVLEGLVAQNHLLQIFTNLWLAPQLIIGGARQDDHDDDKERSKGAQHFSHIIISMTIRVFHKNTFFLEIHIAQS